MDDFCRRMIVFSRIYSQMFYKGILQQFISLCKEIFWVLEKRIHPTKKIGGRG